ncbi:MAG TPA: zinc-dependent metalloprotease [Candidatus Eremiobacteraceae bacterium]|nr:zinc-dependent metalloprotease [Candidatus Eremiobacteraceae bacterium]
MLRTSVCIALIVACALWSRPARADAPDTYAKWTAGKQSQPGLFPIWRDGGKVYLEAAADQLGKDYIEQGIPVSGLGGWDITPGNPYFDFARIIRFTRTDDKISITWPNTFFVAPDGTPQQRAVDATFSPSVIALAPIVAEDAATGRVIFDASALLGDVSDFTDGINQTIGITDPQAQYHLDPDRTSFGPAQAFPDNDVIEVDQTFASAEPPNSVDNVPDPRSLLLKLDYNIDEAPSDGYMPRIADERIGYYPNIQLQFGNDDTQDRQLRYILRWNFAPADPTKPSNATHPMVYYLSDTIPARFHDTIRDAILEWNPVLAKAGILNAVVVKDQPADPSFDPNDLRYNVVRWLTESNSGGFSQAGSVWDPRTGELFHVGIVIDSDLMRYAYYDWRDRVDPNSSALFAPHESDEAGYGRFMRQTAAFGRIALSAMGELNTPAEQNAYDQAYLRAIVLHESGHEMGLQHNFIGSEAYTAQQIRSKAFTQTYGIASSVMEYAPTNVWPKGMSTGDYFQAVPGPYDEYVIHWGYAPIPGATTPQAEVPTLSRWASDWSNPWHRFAMDEDVQYADAHAIDPRVSQGDLTNDNLSWCDYQDQLADSLMATIAKRYPGGEAFDPARTEFSDLLYDEEGCMSIAEHYVGGEYVNRSHVGDPGFDGVPLSPVPRALEARAFAFLDRHVFSDAAWNYDPMLLRRLVYTEWVTDFPQPSWAYDPPMRHDMPIADLAAFDQSGLLADWFRPLMLQRLDDLPSKYGTGTTMSLSDLFDWMQRSAFGDLSAGGLSTIPEIHRALQQRYARLLASMLLHPAPGLPYDAQSLARSELKSLATATSTALRSPKLDAVTRAHLESLSDLATESLTAHVMIDPAP